MNKGVPRLFGVTICLVLICGIRNLKRELVRAQEEIKRIQSVPLVIGQFMEAIDQKYDHNTPDYIFK
jgi:hypothetical protein